MILLQLEVTLGRTRKRFSSLGPKLGYLILISRLPEQLSSLFNLSSLVEKGELLQLSLCLLFIFATHIYLLHQLITLRVTHDFLRILKMILESSPDRNGIPIFEPLLEPLKLCFSSLYVGSVTPEK